MIGKPLQPGQQRDVATKALPVEALERGDPADHDVLHHGVRGVPGHHHAAEQLAVRLGNPHTAPDALDAPELLVATSAAVGIH
ncbi:hypothetical protein AB0H12_08715 [Actinosynnema sp. NPDC023794]